MDTHHRVAAILHIICGVLGTAVLLLMMIFLSALFGAVQDVPGWIESTGKLLLVPFLLLAVGQVVAGVCYLNGRPAARIALLANGVLGLLNFPIGTLIGIYTLWALLRTAPLARSA